MADIDCYLCVAAPGSGAAVNNFQSNLGNPLGCCVKCGVFACGHHAIRNSSPKGWECVVCVPNNVASPPGPGGGPTQPQGGGPGSGPAPVSRHALKPYSEEEFAIHYPTSPTLFREAIRHAVEDPEAVMEEYFGENFRQQVADAFAIQGDLNAAQNTRIAAALAVVLFTGLPDHVLSPNLQRHREIA